MITCRGDVGTNLGTRETQVAILRLSSGRPLTLAVIGLTAGVAADFGQIALAQSDPFERCRTINDDAARLRCYERAAGQGEGPVDRQEVGPWHLVRTPNPGGGPDAVSITRTPVFAKSDANFAGVMLRCSKDDFEVLAMVIEPMPPHARPRVWLKAGRNEHRFEGTVLPPGVTVLLPADAATLATGPWQQAPELEVKIEHEQTTTHGAVGLSDLGPALARLRANCPAR
jgi:hypothetical protein